MKETDTSLSSESLLRFRCRKALRSETSKESLDSLASSPPERAGGEAGLAAVSVLRLLLFISTIALKDAIFQKNKILLIQKTPFSLANSTYSHTKLHSPPSPQTQRNETAKLRTSTTGPANLWGGRWRFGLDIADFLFQ